MRRLSGTDAMFLAIETPTWHQHVGGVTVLEPGPEGLTYDDVVERIVERILLVPKFTWKLGHVPLGLDLPYWVDDPEFDVRRHLHHVAVPAPGGPREIGELAGRIMSTQLDRDRPLWEMYVVEGLAHGRLAMILKYHHCLLDGVSGAALSDVLLDLSPDQTQTPPAPSPADQRAGGPATAVQLATGVLERVVRSPGRWGRFAAGSAAKLAKQVSAERRSPGTLGSLRPPTTSLRAAVGRHRRLAFASVAMEDVKALKKAHGVTFNDLVLALASGALRSYLMERGELPDESLTAAVPISTRAHEDVSQDNQFDSMMVRLATEVADPVARLRVISESTLAGKALNKELRALRVPAMGEVASPWLAGTVADALYRSKLVLRSPFGVSTVVSNVAGPPIPLYVAGVRVTGIYPMSVVMEGMAANVTVLSNMERLDIGIHVDPDLVPDPWRLAEGMQGALDELLEVSGLGPRHAVIDPFGTK